MNANNNNNNNNNSALKIKWAVDFYTMSGGSQGIYHISVTAEEAVEYAVEHRGAIRESCRVSRVGYSYYY